MDLDDGCSRYFTYRMLIACGETFHVCNVENLPKETLTWQALSALACYLLDPVVDQFGELKLTFGLCSSELAQARRRHAKAHGLLPSIYPPVDQHACYEKNAGGSVICPRSGAAVDFFVPNVSTLTVTRWMVGNLPFDRIYYYAPDRPLHVSYNAEESCRDVTVMKQKKSGRGFVPATLSASKFLETYADEP